MIKPCGQTVKMMWSKFTAFPRQLGAFLNWSPISTPCPLLNCLGKLSVDPSPVFGVRSDHFPKPKFHGKSQREFNATSFMNKEEKGSRPSSPRSEESWKLPSSPCSTERFPGVQPEAIKITARILDWSIWNFLCFDATSLDTILLRISSGSQNSRRGFSL